MSKIICFDCQKELPFPAGNVSRSEECPHCRADVRVCFNCRHYDASSYNECAETMAERVTDKNRRNFCDYFFLVGANAGSSGESTKQKALSQLDALFKK